MDPVPGFGASYRRAVGAIATGLLVFAGTGPMALLAYHDWAGSPWEALPSCALFAWIVPVVVGVGTLIPAATFRGRLFRAAVTIGGSLFLAFLGVFQLGKASRLDGPPETLAAFFCTAALIVPAMIAAAPIGEWAASPAEADDQDALATQAIGLWMGVLVVAEFVLSTLAFLPERTDRLARVSVPMAIVFAVALSLVAWSRRRQRAVHALVDAVLSHGVSGLRIRVATPDDHVRTLPRIVSGRVCDGILEAIEEPAHPFREPSATTRALRRAPLARR